MCKYQEHFDSPLHDPFKKETALIQFFFFTIKMFLHSLFPPREAANGNGGCRNVPLELQVERCADPETGYLRSWWRGSRATTAAGCVIL